MSVRPDPTDHILNAIQLDLCLTRPMTSSINWCSDLRSSR